MVNYTIDPGSLPLRAGAQSPVEPITGLNVLNDELCVYLGAQIALLLDFFLEKAQLVHALGDIVLAQQQNLLHQLLHQFLGIAHLWQRYGPQRQNLFLHRIVHLLLDERLRIIFNLFDRLLDQLEDHLVVGMAKIREVQAGQPGLLHCAVNQIEVFRFVDQEAQAVRF